MLVARVVRELHISRSRNRRDRRTGVCLRQRGSHAPIVEVVAEQEHERRLPRPDEHPADDPDEVAKIRQILRDHKVEQNIRLSTAGRAKLGLAFNEMVRSGELSAPIVIGRDHLDSGSVSSPNRETEAMQDGSDAVSDWPLLNALLNTASGATWVSLHHGGGVGMGFSQHSGMVIVCDGTDEAAARIARVLTNDPGTGVMRHADAGYQIAIDCAREQGLNLPMIG